MSVQYFTRAIRAMQVATGLFFFFGEQAFGALGRAPPHVLAQMHDNRMVTAGAVYGLDVIAQTSKSINAFEITYNGQLLHSKLATGSFPDADAVAAKLRAAMAKESKGAPAEQN